jgi:tight adherence protein C
MSFPAGLLVLAMLVGGVALAGSGAPRQRRPRLAARLDPYLRGLQPERTRLLAAGEPPLTPLPALERLLRPLLQEGARVVERWLGGSAAVARRLREAGAAGDLGRFRAEQVLWGLIGFVAAVLLALAMPALAGRPVSAVALVGGAVLRGRRRGARPRLVAQPAGRPAAGPHAAGAAHPGGPAVPGGHRR